MFVSVFVNPYLYIRCIIFNYEHIGDYIYVSINPYIIFFEFKIDSIQRFEEDSYLKVSWDGKAINAEGKDEKEMLITSKNDFKIISVEAKQDNEPYVSVNFSDALKMIENEEIIDARTIMLLQYLQLSKLI